MIEAGKYWVAKGQKIDDINNIEDVITFDWSKNPTDDYIKLSESFYYAARIIAEEIVEH